MFTIRFVFAVALVANSALAWSAPPTQPRNATASEKLSAVDQQAIEKVIRDQLDAFGHDDAMRAFSHASPDIQRMFGTPDRFMRMVRENYEAVYRPGSIRFVRLERVDARWVETVQIVDDEGNVWRALFTMTRQPDKIWKIGGCQLVATNAITT